MINIFNNKCEDYLLDADECIVNTIVTSPPYSDRRKDSYGGIHPDKYLEWFLPISKEFKRVLKDDGNFFLNIKEHKDNGERHTYVIDLIVELRKQGWLWVEEFIWNKTNPFPTGNNRVLKDGFERVFQFTKTKKYKFFPENVLVKSTSKWNESEKKRSNKGEHKVTNGSGMNMSKRFCNDMVRPSNVITGSTSNLNLPHSAVFPEYLPKFFIELTTEENDLVLDPFAGSGTTGVVCNEIKRNCILIESDYNNYLECLKRISV